MSRFCPHYPPPAAKRPSAWRMYFSKRRSWLDGLYERSYRMKLGEVHLPGVDLYMVNEPGLVRHVGRRERHRTQHGEFVRAESGLFLQFAIGGIQNAFARIHAAFR